MTWLVALAVVGALMGVTVLICRPPQRTRRLTFDEPAPEQRFLGLADSDARELIELGHRVEQEFGLVPVQILLNRLGTVTRRHVPVRAIRRGSSRGLARICFADGTTLQVRGREVGDLGQLAVTALTQKVWLADYRTEQSHVVLDLDWHRGHVTVLAVGLDQAD